MTIIIILLILFFLIHHTLARFLGARMQGKRPPDGVAMVSCDKMSKNTNRVLKGRLNDANEGKISKSKNYFRGRVAPVILLLVLCLYCVVWTAAAPYPCSDVVSDWRCVRKSPTCFVLFPCVFPDRDWFIEWDSVKIDAQKVKWLLHI